MASSFYNALKIGDFDAVKSHVESILSDPEVSNYPRLFASEFQFAVSKGFNEIAIYLAGKGVDVHHSFHYDSLVTAASQNNIEIVRLIIGDSICNFENGNYGLCMAYRMAVKNNCTEVVDFLLDHSDIKFKFSELLIKNARSGNLDAVMDLVEKGANVNDRRGLALRNAAEFGQADVVKYLLSKGADMDLYNQQSDANPIQLAAKNGHLNVVIVLIETGANVYINDITFQNALFHGKLEIIKYFIENDIAHTLDKDRILCESIKHYDVFKYLVEHGCDVHENNNYIFKLAASYHRFDIIRCILDLNPIAYEGDEISTYIRILEGELEIDDNRDVAHYIQAVINFIRLCQKMYQSQRHRAAKVIYFWWIPICYDITRPCGQRMAQKNLEQFKELCAEHGIPHD